MQHLLLFRCNSGCTNEPQCYATRTLPVVVISFSYLVFLHLHLFLCILLRIFPLNLHTHTILNPLLVLVVSFSSHLPTYFYSSPSPNFFLDLLLLLNLLATDFFFQMLAHPVFKM